MRGSMENREWLGEEKEISTKKKKKCNDVVFEKHVGKISMKIYDINIWSVMTPDE